MTFSIRLLSEAVSSSELGEKTGWGLITIGSFEERFAACLNYWCVTDYERHWKQAIMRITHSSTVSCLITSMEDPATANFIYWWPMYRVDDIVYIQNHILMLEQLPATFDPNDPFRFVPERETMSENGEKISEWPAPVKDVQAFLMTLRDW